MAKAAQGRRGSKGDRGITGPRGERGPVGPAGPKMQAAEILALVDDQFAQIRKQMEIQLQRTAQLQMQLDKIQKNTTEACSALDFMRPLIKTLVKGD